MKKEEILKSLASLKNEVREKYKAELKGIFGSYVKGKEREDSDLDILVDFNENADLFDFVGLSLFLEEKLDNKVDVVPQIDISERIKVERATGSLSYDLLDL